MLKASVCGRPLSAAVQSKVTDASIEIIGLLVVAGADPHSERQRGRYLLPSVLEEVEEVPEHKQAILKALGMG